MACQFRNKMHARQQKKYLIRQSLALLDLPILYGFYIAVSKSRHCCLQNFSLLSAKFTIRWKFHTFHTTASKTPLHCQKRKCKLLKKTFCRLVVSKSVFALISSFRYSLKISDNCRVLHQIRHLEYLTGTCGVALWVKLKWHFRGRLKEICVWNVTELTLAFKEEHEWIISHVYIHECPAFSIMCMLYV